MAQNEEKKNNILLNNLEIISTPENIQKYILGTKKNGQARAIYDIVKDYAKPKKKKKKKNKNKHNGSNNDLTSYSLYVTAKKKKDKKKKKKHWHI